MKEIKGKKQKWNTIINISWVRYKEKKCMTAIIAASLAVALIWH